MAGRWRRGRFRQGTALLVMLAALSGGPAHAQSNDDLDALNRQIEQLYQAGKYGEAIPIAQRALALAERHGPDHPHMGTALSNLAVLYKSQGRYAEAEPLYKRSLAIREKALGPDHPGVSGSLNNLAALYHAQGHYAEAEPLYKRSLAIFEKTLGSEHPDVGGSLNNLAELYRVQGRYAEAEPLYKRSLAIREKALGPDHPDVGASLNNLALLYASQGHTAQAEPLYKRTISIVEKALGPDHPYVGTSLDNLAALYHAEGRYADAEPLSKRSIAITARVLGPDHPNVSRSLNNLAAIYKAQGRYADAEPLYKRSLAIIEKALGPDHPDVGTSLDNLAALYHAEGRYAEAEPLSKRSLAMREMALGPDHPSVGTSLNNLGELYRAQGRYAEAELLYKRDLAIIEKALGPDHPHVGQSLGNLAALYAEQGKWPAALVAIERATTLHAWRGSRVAADKTGSTKREVAKATNYFRGYVLIADRVDGDRSTQTGRSYLMAQLALRSETADAVSGMAARFAAGSGTLADLVRRSQDLSARRAAVDARLIAAIGQGATAAQALRMEIAGLEKHIEELDARLTGDFPAYAALANPQPLDIAATQKQLGADEALLQILTVPATGKLPEVTFAWLVTKTESRWVKLALPPSEIAEHVTALRCGLDATLWRGDKSPLRCRELLKATPVEEVVNGQRNQVLPFDTARAHTLYKALLGPFEDLIKGKHLLVVPDGALTSLPFNVFVTQPHKIAIPGKLVEYRTVAWLGTRQAVTVLPSVASLKALRQFAKASRATKLFLGIGNPLLDGSNQDHAELAKQARAQQSCPRQPTLKERIALAVSRPLTGFSSLFRGAQADIEAVRAWTPLPETADELCAIGGRLGVPESDILLGARATETTLKDLSEAGPLADYAILHFATHGALAGQVKGAAEPGLILTPPSKGTDDANKLARDDGFLTASEIATLKLDADWVILSACNTAAGSGEYAEALSGLARTFFYAGARALLVSHWEVGSDAAVKLTTRTFAELKNKPATGRAEAFRISMRELVDKGEPLEAHPSMWAPFIVVGEGAAGK